MTDKGLQPLLPHCTSALLELDLSHNHISFKGARQLVKFLQTDGRSLQKVCMTMGSMSSHPPQACACCVMYTGSILAAHNCLDRMLVRPQLSLEGNMLRDTAVRQLCTQLQKHPTLTSLNIGYTHFEDSGASAVAQLLVRPSSSNRSRA